MPVRVGWLDHVSLNSRYHGSDETVGVRVLFTCRPGAGHYYPMRPLLDALVAAGDEVAVATGDPLAHDVEAEGTRVFRVGLDEGDPLMDHHRQVAAGLPASDICPVRVRGVGRGWDDEWMNDSRGGPHLARSDFRVWREQVVALVWNRSFRVRVKLRLEAKRNGVRINLAP